MEITQNKAFEIIGQQQMEIVILRERIGILTGHKCEPCDREHVGEHELPMEGEVVDE